MFGFTDVAKAVVDNVGFGAFEKFGKVFLNGDDGFELADVEVEFGKVVDGFDVEVGGIESAICFAEVAEGL